MIWPFRYFWFIVAAVMLVNVAIWRRHLLPLAAQGALDQDEVDRFTRGAAYWLAGPAVLLGLISLWANWPAPFCAGVLSFANWPQAATSAVLLSAWVALLWWVWVGRGAPFLARVWPALSRPPARSAVSPAQVRLAVTALVLVSAVGGTVAWRQMPPLPPEMGCPAPHVAA